MNNNYRRGSVWWVDLPLDTSTHVQGGARPCVIVSNTNCQHSSVVTVCPMSTRIDKIPTHVKVNVRKEGQVLCEQITTIDASELGDYCGCVNRDGMEKVDAVLSKYLSWGKEDRDIMDTDSRITELEAKIDKMSQMLEFMCWREQKK